MNRHILVGFAIILFMTACQPDTKENNTRASKDTVTNLNITASDTGYAEVNGLIG